MLVEDEALIRMMVAEMVEELGHRVTAEAGTLEAAIATARDSAFDVALLDVNLGGLRRLTAVR
nr:response regulator [Bradyrhizobium zhengyangense]